MQVLFLTNFYMDGSGRGVISTLPIERSGKALNSVAGPMPFIGTISGYIFRGYQEGLSAFGQIGTEG